MGNYRLAVEFESDDVDTLKAMCGESVDLLRRIEGGGEFTKDDVELALAAASFVINMVFELTNQNREIAEDTANDLLRAFREGGLSDDAIEEYSKHDCDECDESGRCPLEAAVREIKRGMTH